MIDKSTYSMFRPSNKFAGPLFCIDGSIEDIFSSWQLCNDPLEKVQKFNSFIGGQNIDFGDF